MLPSFTGHSRRRRTHSSGPPLRLIALFFVGCIGLFILYQYYNDSLLTRTPYDFSEDEDHDLSGLKDTINGSKSPPGGQKYEPEHKPISGDVSHETPEGPTVPLGEPVWKARAEEVKKSFLHAWDSYEKYAWGADELLPLAAKKTQTLNGWGVTIIDSLDTLLLMDLQPQFAKAMEHVEQLTFQQPATEQAAFFETVIRYLGGLLSAHALLSDEGHHSSAPWTANKSEAAIAQRQRWATILLSRADTLGHALLPVFKTQSGLPAFSVNTMTGVSASHGGLLAEIGSYQMEFKYLAYLTGRREYFEAANHPLDILEKLQNKQLSSGSQLGGMLPSNYNLNTGEPTSEYLAVGALADSAYEYLLKGYLLSGRSETRLLDMYLRTVHTALEKMTFVSSDRNMTFICDINGKYPSYKFEHLSCFYPGLLALGASTLNAEISHDSKVEISKSMQERHMLAAEGIAESCYLVYADNPTKLGHETVHFSTTTDHPLLNWWQVIDSWEANGRQTSKPMGIHGADTEKMVAPNPASKHYAVGVPDWLLRPETIESLYIMYRTTKEPVWRERCYEIYQGIEKHSRTKTGYASVKTPHMEYTIDTEAADYQRLVFPYLSESMPSYALSETFKYLFLCMMNPDESSKLLNPNKWIFTTEAHPFPVFNWTDHDIAEWKIR